MENPYLKNMYKASAFAEHVKLDVPKTIEWGGLLSRENFTAPSFDGDIPDELWMDFVFWTSSINFAFTDFGTGKPYELEYPSGKIHKGSSAMIAAFKRALDSNVPVLDGSFWKDAPRTVLADIFSGKSPLPMMDQRLENLKQNGKVLAERYGGLVGNIFKKSHFSCFAQGRHPGLIEILANEFSFFDSNLYRPNDREAIIISFNKRAYLTAMLYQGRVLNSERSVLTPLKGYEYLLLPADYRTPQALCALGTIRYSDALCAKIVRGEMIPAGSREEIEMRFQSIIAAEELKTEINALRLGADMPEITILELDYFLWSYGRKLGSQGQKHHLTETTAY